MTKNWPKLRYFKPAGTIDNWGESSRISHELLLRLDSFRHFIGTPIVVTSGTGGVHKKNSQHYLGKAVDIIVPKWKQPLIDLYFISERFNFTGVGVYRDWSYRGVKTGGLHVDVRDLKPTPPYSNFASNRWLCTKETVDGKLTQVYHALTFDNFIKLFNI